jgi:hypothetical protein
MSSADSVTRQAVRVLDEAAIVLHKVITEITVGIAEEAAQVLEERGSLGNVSNKPIWEFIAEVSAELWDDVAPRLTMFSLADWDELVDKKVKEYLKEYDKQCALEDAWREGHEEGIAAQRVTDR